MLARNWDTVMAFMVVQSQWRYTQGVRTGLDYASCQAALTAHKFDFDVLLPGLQVMEAEVLKTDVEEMP